MNFGEILDAWDEEKRVNRTPRSEPGMDDWLDMYPPDPSDTKLVEKSEDATSGHIDRSEFMNMPHGAELDLHGLTVAEATSRVEAFLQDAHSRGIRKVLIIHGKGLHSEKGESVLARATRSFLQSHKLAGRIEYPPRRWGGRGALWVLVK